MTSKFHFESFYLGCVFATGESVTSKPVSCSVTLIESKASVEVARQTFDFDPGTLSVTANMIEAQLRQEFKGVDIVRFSSTYSVPGNGATLLDNLKYVTYDSQKKW